MSSRLLRSLSGTYYFTKAARISRFTTRVPTPQDGKTLADFLPKTAEMTKAVRLPPWLKMSNPGLTPERAETYKHVRSTVAGSGCATVCQEARCPNVGECWSTGTATVMIMGDTCTRGCRFCSVKTSRAPPPLDPEEPRRLAEAVAKWAVDYIVITMVDRDDLEDGGAGHVVETVKKLKNQNDGLRVEALVGDFQGCQDLVKMVACSGLDVFAHNIETVRRLQPIVRDRRAGYEQSLRVLRRAKEFSKVTKSSIMVGLGETRDEISEAMGDLWSAGVDILTLGQYLRPTKRHLKVQRFLHPDEFRELKEEAVGLGFHVAAGPMVRSSYKAGDLFSEMQIQRTLI